MNVTFWNPLLLKKNELIKNAALSDYGSADMPGDTIVTEPYFSDVLVTVALAGGRLQGK